MQQVTVFCKIKTLPQEGESTFREKKAERIYPNNVKSPKYHTLPPPPSDDNDHCQKQTYRYVTLPAVTSADMVILERRKEKAVDSCARIFTPAAPR